MRFLNFIGRLAVIFVMYLSSIYFSMVMCGTVTYTEQNGMVIDEATSVILLSAAWIVLMFNILMAREFGIENWRWQKPTVRDCRVLLMYTLCVWAFTYGLNLVFYWLNYYQLTNQEMVLWLRSHLPTFCFVILAIFYAPILEEILFRAGIMGYLFRNHLRLSGVISTLLFTLFHSPAHISAWLIYARWEQCSHGCIIAAAVWNS